MSNKMQLYTVYFSVNCCKYFGWFLHPSSAAQITVSTASGTGQPLLLSVGIVGELRLQSRGVEELRLQSGGVETAVWRS